MSVFMWIYIVLLLYASYVKIVGLLFAGRQHNRFFGTFLCTFIPVLGSIPTFIMASKYERRVGGLAAKTNDYVLRCAIIVIQVLSVFMLFFPFFKTEGIYADGINLMIGLAVDGEVIFKPAYFMSYLLIAPFLSAIINAIDVKYNIRNIVTYISSLICCITVSLIAVFVNTDGAFLPTTLLWLYCIANVGVMILSFLSLVNVRNSCLSVLEAEESVIYAPKAAPVTEKRTPEIAEDMYRCSKCGNLVQKGTVCSCRNSGKETLNKLMERENRKESSDFCVYCRKSLKPGEKCICMGEGFGITVKPEQFEGRKCKYCGQILAGDSICVCEKIMNKSVPVSEDAVPKTYFNHNPQASMDIISEEMEELEKKIDSRISEVKSSISAADKTE